MLTTAYDTQFGFILFIFFTQQPKPIYVFAMSSYLFSIIVCNWSTKFLASFSTAGVLCRSAISKIRKIIEKKMPLKTLLEWKVKFAGNILEKNTTHRWKTWWYRWSPCCSTEWYPDRFPAGPVPRTGQTEPMPHASPPKSPPTQRKCPNRWALAWSPTGTIDSRSRSGCNLRGRASGRTSPSPRFGLTI